jgi:hypothetical protein
MTPDEKFRADLITALFSYMPVEWDENDIGIVADAIIELVEEEKESIL